MRKHEKQAVSWFESYAQDIPRANGFDEAVFAAELERLNNPDPQNLSGMERWAFSSSMECYGSVGALVKMVGQYTLLAEEAGFVTP